jgi:hypothetical protein
MMMTFGGESATAIAPPPIRKHKASSARGMASLSWDEAP